MLCKIYYILKLLLIPSINYRAQLILLRQSNIHFCNLNLKLECNAQQKVARVICISCIGSNSVYLDGCVSLTYLLLRQRYLKISQYITKKSPLMQMASQHHVNSLLYYNDNPASKRRDDDFHIGCNKSKKYQYLF